MSKLSDELHGLQSSSPEYLDPGVIPTAHLQARNVVFMWFVYLVVSIYIYKLSSQDYHIDSKLNIIRGES